MHGWRAGETDARLFFFFVCVQHKCIAGGCCRELDTLCLRDAPRRRRRLSASGEGFAPGREPRRCETPDTLHYTLSGAARCGANMRHLLRPARRAPRFPGRDCRATPRGTSLFDGAKRSMHLACLCSLHNTTLCTGTPTVHLHPALPSGCLLYHPCAPCLWHFAPWTFLPNTPTSARPWQIFRTYYYWSYEWLRRAGETSSQSIHALTLSRLVELGIVETVAGLVLKSRIPLRPRPCQSAVTRLAIGIQYIHLVPHALSGRRPFLQPRGGVAAHIEN